MGRCRGPWSPGGGRPTRHQRRGTSRDTELFAESPKEEWDFYRKTSIVRHPCLKEQWCWGQGGDGLCWGGTVQE